MLFLHFSGRFLLTTSLRRRRMSVNAHFFIHCSNSCKLYRRTPGNFLKLLFIIVATKSVFFFKFDLGAARHPSPRSARWMCPCITEKVETHIRSGGVERSIFTIARNRTEFLLHPARNQVTIRSKPSRPCLVQDNDHLFVFYSPPYYLIYYSKEAKTSMKFSFCDE